MKYRVILKHETGKYLVQHSENGLTWAPVIIGFPGNLHPAEFDANPEAELFMISFCQKTETESFHPGHFTVKSKLDTREIRQGLHQGILRYDEPDTKSLDYIVQQHAQHPAHADRAVGLDSQP